MFWSRTPAVVASPASTQADTNGVGSVLQAATSRSMGFLAALDVYGASDGAAKTDNQSAGENASEETDGVRDRGDEDRDFGDDVALPPSYILSEQRRNELLRAARATRTSWVDGNGHGVSDKERERSGGSEWTTTTTSSGVVPAHCQIAADQIRLEMQSLVTWMDQLKRKIIPIDVLDEKPVGGDDCERDNNQLEKDASVTIADELRVHGDELESWRRVHLVDGKLSPMQRKRLTASDKESLFLLAFHDLLKLLKHPLAAEIVYQIQMFVKKFEHWNLEAMLRHRALADRPGGYVQAFIDKLVLQLQRTGTPLFQAAGVEILSLDDDVDQLLPEVLESFLLEKLYQKALTPSAKAEREDDALRERLESLSFVEFRHLDLPVPATKEIERQWEDLAEQLAMMPLFPSARRKMDCVMRVCQGLTSLLSSLHADGKFPSADEFLPGLIYLLLKSNPRQLQRNVHYILEYRRPSRLVSEPGYFFTHLVSSVAFLEQVNGELLTITPEEFEAGLQRSKRRVVVELAQPAEPLASINESTACDIGTSDQFGTSRPILQVQLPTVIEVRARRLASLGLSR